MRQTSLFDWHNKEIQRLNREIEKRDSDIETLKTWKPPARIVNWQHDTHVKYLEEHLSKVAKELNAMKAVQYKPWLIKIDSKMKEMPIPEDTCYHEWVQAVRPNGNGSVRVWPGVVKCVKCKKTKEVSSFVQSR